MSFWPFNRKKKQPPKDRRGWNEDWRVGDLAVCINDNWRNLDGIDPRKGDLLRVSGFKEGIGDAGSLASFLKFEGKPQNRTWDNVAFRKVRPDNRADEVEEGIIAKIKGGVRA